VKRGKRIFRFPVRVAPKGGLRFTLSPIAPLAGAFFMRECRGRGGAHNLACAGATPAPATSFQLGGVDTVQRRTWSKAIREAVDRGHAGEVASDSQCTSLRKHFGASEYREVPSAVRRQSRKPVLPCWSSDQPELIIYPCWGRSLTPAVRYLSRLHGVTFTTPPTSTPALKETCRPSQQFVAGRYMRGGLLGPKQVYLTDSPHKGLPEKEGTKRNKQDDQLTRPTGKAGRGMLGNRSNPAPFDC
jgi:hypothetical protein